jgi:hypothetical protein
MNAPKVKETDYIQFLIAALIAAQRVYSCVEAERVSPEGVAHDAYTRLLSRLPPDREALWAEAKELIEPTQGGLIVDDSSLDKRCAKAIALVTKHWSGKHHGVVQGINLESLGWSDGEKIVPVDCRLYAKAEDQQTKNDHARAMFTTAKEGSFEPEVVMFDSSRLKISGRKSATTDESQYTGFSTRNRKHCPLDYRQDCQPRFEVENPQALLYKRLLRIVNLEGRLV